jgi:predicted TIM-barrel fold metal-dependent hydrolase
MFLESDTTVAVLTGLPAVDDPNNPITNSEIAAAKGIIDALAEDSERLINHHMVLPNQMGPSGVQAQLDAMERTLDVYRKVGAWKMYPAWSPQNTEQAANDGWFLDDPQTGLKVVQKGLELGVGTFCIHKGLPIPAFSTKYNDPVDIGRVAKLFPAAKFIIYHSGYGHQGYNEGPYSMGSRVGTNSLITALLENGITPNSNVYAELGTTWQLVSTLPVVGGTTAAAHVIGKLLKYVGEDNVVWGTDSIWYGSPQSQIESFLQFQISEQFQKQYGYPALSMEIKAKILGRNAAKAYGINVEAMRCAVDQSKLALHKQELDSELGDRRWAFHQPPLRSRRDFWALHRKNGFRPG